MSWKLGRGHKGNGKANAKYHITGSGLLSGNGVESECPEGAH